MNILETIEENALSGYETAVIFKDNSVVKYGSLLDQEPVMAVKELLIWNNSNIDIEIAKYNRID